MIAAIIPAAGRSVRMGRPKLLLEHNGRSVLAGVIDALRRGGANMVIAVVPPETEPEGPTLADAAFKAGAAVIAPAIRPAEMRDSIEVGIGALRSSQVAAPDSVLIVPADSPELTPAVVRQVIDRRGESPASSLIVPCSEGRRGHPILIPWATAIQIRDLPPGVGLNSLVAAELAAGRVIEIQVPNSSALADLDTPDDWARLQARLNAKGTSSRTVNRFSVRLFALARQRAGAPEVVVQLADGGTVADLKLAIAEGIPALADLLPNVLIAIDSDYAADGMIVPKGAQIAVIPPVSGGET